MTCETVGELNAAVQAVNARMRAARSIFFCFFLNGNSVSAEGSLNSADFKLFFDWLMHTSNSLSVGLVLAGKEGN